MSEQFFNELSTTYNIDLSQDQQAAVRHKDGPCLLLAVPGGGKTTTLLSRTAYLIKEKDVPAERLLTITFSRASANDMKARFQHLFKGTVAGKVSFSTIHSFAYGVVMSYMRNQGRQLTLIEGQQNPKLSKGRILRQLYKQVNNDFISEGDFELLTGDLSYVKNIMMAQEDIPGYRSEIRNFHKIMNLYENYKEEHHLIDFDDMLTSSYRILKTDEKVRIYYQKRYDYIQVDEAQDTSRLQHGIIALLAASHKNVLYVADDDQAIYGFRGASPTYLLNLRSVYPQARIISMEQNYRSTGAIVELTNKFIKTNTKRYDKAIKTHKPNGLPVLIHQVAARPEQYQKVVQAIENLEDHGQAAVLYRNNHSAVSMVHALGETGIPFKLKGLRRKYFDHWVIRDIMTILDFAEHTEDLQSFKSFYYKLRGYYVSKSMTEQIKGYNRDRSVFYQIIHDCNLAPYQMTNVRNMEEDFRILAAKPIHEAIEYLLTTMGYLEFLMDTTNGPTATFESYNMMIEVMKDLAKTADSLHGLEMAMKAMEARIKEASENTDPKALTLSTVHSAKGLEWTYVHMIDLISGIFPNKDVIDSNDLEGMEEERRLFYVGMTRAKEDLTIYKVNNNMVSEFVKEVEDILNPSKKKNTTGNLHKSQAGHQVNYRQTAFGESHEPMMPGAEIVHKVYGKGVVKTCSGDKIVLVFPDGEKVLNFNFCMNKGLLMLDQQPLDQ